MIVHAPADNLTGCHVFDASQIKPALKKRVVHGRVYRNIDELRGVETGKWVLINVRWYKLLDYAC
ncbi:MAG TPA: hypothetical protein QGG18_04780 [Rhodospirillales bacterium]|nr:hypothetical protein [Rhodospirillales bacterium]